MFLLNGFPFQAHVRALYPVSYVLFYAWPIKFFTCPLVCFLNPKVTCARRVMQQLKHVGQSLMVKSFGKQSQSLVLFGVYDSESRL